MRGAPSRHRPLARSYGEGANAKRSRGGEGRRERSFATAARFAIRIKLLLKPIEHIRSSDAGAGFIEGRIDGLCQPIRALGQLQFARRDLPGDAPSVFAPTAFTFLAATAQNLHKLVGIVACGPPRAAFRVV